ncbi:MAG: long-chain fatty acid--CoA ligase [Ardenticatenaceae bacterium]|nr:long-chain fatty acid--CoA ligase [Anaerolineales bacterium]MCB8922121.1 long-chain fatty acid--CoA ligase [Ardenticatenaceae bacterium]MCB8991101.1 long-chain fatty acid--CoA ligase [Ardenticatenaceae bacterium]
MLNLATLLETSVQELPQKTAVVFGDTRLSYAQINGAANQIANGLKAAGIEKGDKVALSCPNLPYFPMVYYGILKAGATVVPLNVLLKRREIAYHLKDSDAKAYFCFEGTPQLPMGQEAWAGFNEVEGCENFWLITGNPAAPSPIEGAKTLGQMMATQSPVFDTVQTDALDTAVILYTSGTTGQPKGAELSHSNIIMNAFVVRELFKQQPNDVQLVTLPLFHSFGQTVQLNAGFLGGHTLVFLARFDPEAAFKALQDENVTVFCGVPTMYWALLNYPDAEKFDLKKISKTLRLGVSGGASLPVEVIKGVEERFSIPILEGYGLSETSPVASFLRMDMERKPGSIGVPIWGIEMRVVDENDNDVPTGESGEIIIRGHNVMKGYYKRPEESAKAFKNGWFHTGDVARKDEDGYYYIVDRIKDMIIRGGYNVYPREIEETLMAHPEVSLAAVIGVPHDEYGQEIKAFVVPKEGTNPDPAALVAWSKENMAAYKYPRIIEVRDTLPMTATGKILKTELRQN